MRAVLISISSDDVDLAQWKPVDPTDFFLDLTLWLFARYGDRQ